MSKVIVVDLQSNTILEEYKPEAKGKIALLSENQLVKFDRDTCVAIHNSLTEGEDQIAEDIEEADAQKELLDLFTGNFDSMAVAIPGSDKKPGKGAGKGDSASKAGKEKGAGKQKGNAANLVPRKRKHAPELKIQVMKSVKSPYEGKKETNRSKIFDTLLASKTVGGFYEACKAAELACGNWDIDNAVEKGNIRLS
jgi:hypothetical protein